MKRLPVKAEFSFEHMIMSLFSANALKEGSSE
jgi:hypothetical protein